MTSTAAGLCSSNPNQIIAVDFNNDNKVDLATADVGDSNRSSGLCTDGGVSVLLGNGNFQKATLARCCRTIYSIAADDSGDIYAANWSWSSLLKSNGDGTFQLMQDFPVGTNPLP